MDDLLSNVKKQRTFLEKIMSYIPLYHGYKEKELRRESDKLLRNYIYQKLLDAKNTMKKIQSEQIDNNKIDSAKKIDKLITICDTVAERIHRAEYGFSGFWDANKVKEKDLDQIYEIDAEISEISESTMNTTTELLSLAKNKVESEKHLSEISDSLDSLQSKITNRTSFLNGVKIDG